MMLKRGRQKVDYFDTIEYLGGTASAPVAESKPTPDSATLSVKVSPGAADDRLAGWMAESLKVRVRAAPERGRANKAVEAVVARCIGLKTSDVQVRSGHTSARKRITVTGLSNAELRARLDRALENGAT